MAELIQRLESAVADRYRVEREIGQGGMAHVFLAHDEHLHRAVALKVLRPEIAARLGPERFLREIRFAASLTHPHILTVIDSGEADGLLFYTMPYIRGETLRARLRREPQLPLDEAVRITGEIAEALDHAHHHGLVHRDVKPENVLLSAGHAVVADFGIARALDDGTGPALTGTGVVVGTPAYMSPEQASGSHAIDGRTDQYGLACTCYEMLAGQPPFTGPTSEAIAHQHLNVIPRPVTDVRPAAGDAIAQVLSRALAKNPADRFPDTAGFAAALAAAAAARVPAARAPSGARRRAWAFALVPVALALAAAAVWFVGPGKRPGPAPALELARVTYDAGISLDPAISRDGRMVAYASDRAGAGDLDLWVQYLDQRSAVRLTRDPAHDMQPSFSPDGARIAFRSERDGGGIYLVPTLGGGERLLVRGGSFPRFSPDGTSIAYVVIPPTDAPARMYRVPADGGEPRPFLPEFRSRPLPAGIGPLWSPDGRALMFNGQRGDDVASRDVWVAPADGGDPVRTDILRTPGLASPVRIPCAWLPGRVLIAAGVTFQGLNLYSVPVSADGHRVTGKARRLTTGPGMRYFVGVSDDGRIVLPDFTWTVHLWSAELDPVRMVATSPPRRITEETAPKFGLSLSRDGSRLAYGTFSGAPERLQHEVRVRDLATGGEATRITVSNGLLLLDPRLAPDDTTLVYHDLVQGHTVALLLRPGETTGREVCRDGRVMAFFGDGGSVLARLERRRIERIDLVSGTRVRLVEADSSTTIEGVALSPDDRWIAFAFGSADERVRIAVVPVRGRVVPRREWMVVVDGPGHVAQPCWSADGERLVYLGDRDGPLCIWAQRLDRATRRPAGEPTAVVHLHRSDLAMLLVRGMWSEAATSRRIFFNAAQQSGNIWQGKLEPR